MKNLLTIAICLISYWTFGQTLVTTPHIKGDIRDLEKYGDYVYIRGAYIVDGDTVGELIRVNSHTGVLDPNWDPMPDNDVNDMIIVNGKLIVGGRFNQIGGQLRDGLAVFDAVTGALLPITPGVNAHTLGFGVEALYGTGDTIYFAYDVYVKRFNLSTGSVDNWAASDITYTDYFRSMTVLGNHLYLGGDFNTNIPPYINDLVRYDLITGALDVSWNSNVRPRVGNGYTITQVITHNNMLYVGGSFDSIGGQDRTGIAAFDAAGNITSFNPDQQGGQIFSLKARGNSLWVGGNFYWLGGDNRWRIAELDINTGMAKSCWDAGVTPASFVWDIELSNDTVFMGCVATSGGSSVYRVFEGETEVATPLYIAGPDTVYAGDTASFITSPVAGYDYQAEWLYENNNGNTVGAYWRDTMNIVWNQLGTRTVSLYHSFNYGCYSDTITKQVVVIARPGSGIIYSEVDPSYYFYEQGSELRMQYQFNTSMPSPTDLLVELSDASGDFTNSTIIGSATAPAFASYGYINGSICHVPHGNNYQARVIAALGSYTYQPSSNYAWYVGYIDSTAQWLTISPSAPSRDIYCSPQSITYRPTFDVFIRDSTNTTYEWYKNGQLVGNSISYTDNSPQDMDSVYLIATPRSGCVAQSLPNILAVTDTNIPTQIQLTSSLIGNGPICPGARDTLKVTSYSTGHTQDPNGNSYFEYHWTRINNGQSSLSGWGPLPALPQKIVTWDRGESYYIGFYSYGSCRAYNFVGVSDTLTPTFFPPPEVTIQTTASDTICSGQVVEFTSTLINGASSPIYRWVVNGATAQYGNDSTYTTSSLQNGDEIYVEVIGSANCSAERDTSNHMTITVYNAGATINNVDTICLGDSYLGYSATGFYTDTLTFGSGCSITRTLDLTVLTPIVTNVIDSICTGGNYLSYTQPGTYVDTFLSAQGCDSIRTLNLSIRADNVSYSYLNDTICLGDSYLGYTYTGTYYDTLVALGGCDSVRVLNLTVLYPYTRTYVRSICAGENYLGYTHTGTHRDTFTRANGCDSIRVIYLTVKPNSTSYLNEYICAGDNYDGYTQTGVYVDTMSSANGCDSIRTLNLTVLPMGSSFNDSITANICAGDSYLGYTQTGIHIDTLSGSCFDTIRVLDLTVQTTYTATYTNTICVGETFMGYSQTGIHIDTLLSVNACDTIRTIDLTVLTAVSTTVVDTICDGDNHAGRAVTGTYVDTFTSASGCDSVRFLDLTVLPVSRSSVFDTICAGTSYYGHTNTGVFIDTFNASNGCDSIRTLNLTVTPSAYDDTSGFIKFYNIGGRGLSAVTGDIDRDGNIDVITCNNNPSSISVLLNNGDGTFPASIDHALTDAPTALAIGDFNGDSLLDVATANFSVHNVSVLLGGGNGTFSAAGTYPTGYRPTSIIAVDLNGDSILDIATANNSSYIISILFGSGTGAFAPAVSVSVGSNPNFVTAADFNSDGIIDLVVSNSNDADISVLIGTGSGAFAPKVDYYIGASVSSISTDDLNGDGIPDLAMAIGSRDNVAVMLGKGSGTFGRPVTYPAGSKPVSITTLDFNNDGILDLATANNSNSSSLEGINVLRGNGNGTFATPFFYRAATEPLSIFKADLNNDGRMDLGAAHKSYTGKVSVLLGYDNTPFDVEACESYSSPTGSAVWTSSGIYTYNLTGAGGCDSTIRVDLTIVDPITYSFDTICYGEDLYGYTQTGLYIDTLRSSNGCDTIRIVDLTVLNAPMHNFFLNEVSYAIPESGVIVTSGDFNGDGIDDIATSSYYSFNTSIYLGTNTGTFVSSGTITLPYRPYYVMSDDLNGDGYDDFISSDSYNDKVTIVLATGTGTFGSVVQYPAGDGPSRVAISDYNGDGFKDLAIVNENDSLAVLLGNGAGGFAAPSVFYVCNEPIEVSAGDFNGDGHMDLAVGQYTNLCRVFIYLNDGSGGFTLANSFRSSYYPYDIRSIDLNNDGALDLAVLTSYHDYLEIFLGTGTGTFGIATQYLVGPDPRDMNIGDFDKNGSPDIVVSDYRDSTIYILLNSGNGTFTPAIEYPVSFGQYSLTTGKFNDDNLDDIAFGSSFGSQFNVLLGNDSAVIKEVVCHSYTSPSGNHTWTTSGAYIDAIPASGGGCDSIITIDLTVLGPSLTIDTTVCFGETVLGYNTTGQYIDTFAAVGCDSIRTLNLTVAPPSTVIDTLVCSGTSVFGYTATGQYFDTLTTSGCQSIRTLNLTVTSYLTATIDTTVCFGDSIDGYGATGQYIDTFSTLTCDSIRTLNLTVDPWATATINTTVCFGDSIDGYGASGQYVDTFSTAGCDSIRTLNLTVLPNSTSTLTTSICDGDSYLGYSLTGVYLDTFAAANGCDSVRTIDLTVLPHSTSTLTSTICDGDNYWGYSATGVYLDTFAAANGCDSVRTIDLTVLPVSSDTISMDIYDGQSYAGYTVTGTYLDTFVAGNGCDSIRLLDLTVLPLDTVWPGDANADGIVDNTDLLNIGIAYNSSGPTRPLASLTWIGQACLPWSSSFISGVNYNNADCNGDGLVDADDSTAVLVNYNLTHAKQTPQARLTDPVLSLVPERSLIGSNETSYLTIHLGDQAVPANNIYGLAFTIDYSSSIVDPASVYADFSTCWVGNEGFDLISLQKHVAAGQIDLAIVRNDHQNQSGFGEIGVLHFTTIQLNGGIQDTFSADFHLTGLLAVDSIGNTIPLNSANTTVAITNTVSGISELVDEQVQLYPNPTDREVQIVSSRPIEQIKVYSVTGQLVLNTKVDKLRTTSVDLGMLNNGLYMVTVFDGHNWHLTKVVMAK